jgi:hypothetical protein
MSIATVYAACCRSYNREPNQDQGIAWTRVLGQFTTDEIEKALDTWRGKTTEYLDRPLGSIFPQPADLKAIVLHERSREIAIREGKFVSCRKCDNGWIKTTIKRTLDDDKVMKYDAVKRCECWWAYLSRVFGCSLEELPAVMKRREEERRSSKRRSA